MCLGIPAQVTATEADHPDLVHAVVHGAQRTINIGLLEEPVAVGDWVMIHMGFALEPMTEAQAKEAMDVLSVDSDALDALLANRPADGMLDGTG